MEEKPSPPPVVPKPEPMIQEEMEDIDWEKLEPSHIRWLRKLGFIPKPTNLIPTTPPHVHAELAAFQTKALTTIPDFLSFKNPFILPSLAPKVINEFLVRLYRIALRTELAPLLIEQTWFRSRGRLMHKFEHEYKFKMLKAYSLQYPYFGPVSFRRRMKRVLLTIFNALFTGNYDFFRSFFRSHYSAQECVQKWISIMEQRSHPWVISKLRVPKVRRVMYRLCYLDPKMMGDQYHEPKKKSKRNSKTGFVMNSLSF